MAGLAVSVVRFAFRGPYSIAKTPQLTFLIGFFLVLTLSPVAATGWFGGALVALETFLTSIVGCVLIMLNVDSVKRMRIAAGVLCLLSLAVTIQGILAYHWGFNAELFVLAQRAYWTDNPLEAPALQRLMGLGYLNDPNDLAQALMAAVPLFWPFWKPGRRMRNFVLVIVPVLTLLYGIYLTKSRGGIVTLLFLTMLWVREAVPRFRKSMPLVAAGAMGFLLIVGGATGGRGMSADDSSAEGRIGAWRAGLHMLAISPVYGVGFGAFVDHHRRTAHNSFVLCFAELGTVGYFFWISLLLAAILDLWTIGHPQEQAEEEEDDDVGDENAELARWSRSVRLSFYAFLVGGFFLSRTYTPTLYLLFALAVAVADIARRNGYAGPRPGFLRVSGYSASFVVASIFVIYAMVTIGETMAG